MKRAFRWLPLCALAIVGGAALGCDDTPAAPLAPTASALAPAKPATAGAKKLLIDKASSQIDFMMEAPEEKIRGRVAGATEGEVNIDPTDLTKTTGLLVMDLSGIELYQVTVDAKGKTSQEAKSEAQNKHARAWLEISDDVPEDLRKKNVRVEYSIKSVESAQPGKDVTALLGADRKVTLKAKGELLLHGRKVDKTAELEATFHYEGDKLASVTVKTVKPFPVGLAEHDVRPREGFGKLAQKTLEIMAPKVAKDAEVSIVVTALAPGAAPAPAPVASASSAAAPPSSASAKPAGK